MSAEIQGGPRERSACDHLAYLLPLLFILAVAVMCWRLPNFEFDADEGGNLMKALLVGREHPLYTESWSDQPPLFTHILAFLFRFAGPSVATGRWLVIGFSGLLLWGAFQYLRTVSGIGAAVGGLGLIVLLPSYVTLSLSVMIGLPAIALAVLALAAFARWRSRGSPWLLGVSAALLALSVLIKGFTLVLLPAFAMGLLLDREVGCLRRRLRALLLWCAVFAGVGLGVVCLLMDASALGQLLKPHWMARGVATYRPYTLALALLPARHLLVLAVAGGVLAWSRRHWHALYPALWLLAATLALAFHRPVWSHQALLVTLPAALLAAEIFTALPWLRNHLLGPESDRKRRAAALALSLLGLILIGAQARRTYRTAVRWLGRGYKVFQAEDWRLTAAMTRHAGATRWVVTDRPIYAFRANLPVPPEMAVISEKRVNVGLAEGEWMLACLKHYQPEQVALVRFSWPQAQPYLDAHYTLVYGQQGRYLFLKTGTAPAGEGGNPLAACRPAAMP